MKKRSVLLKLFFSTLYLSAFTFGSGYAAMIEYINGIEVIKAFNQSRTSYARLVDKVKANAQYYYDWMRRSQLDMSMAYAFFPAQMLTVLLLGWVFYTHGTLTAEVFITVIILSLGMSAPIVAAFNFVDTLAQVGTTVAQVDEILNAEEQVHSETPVTFSDHTVVLKDVCFGYHADQEILHGVSLTIPQNKMTALVGTSGGGKSTIAKLAAGFWDAGSGSITMGGHELKDIPLTQLYDQAAFVSQDNYLFDGSIRDNIAAGRPAASMAEVMQAAQLAGAHEFILELDEGYDTRVGERGAGLSGGQRQRIAIARALLTNPRILIFDEATSALDYESEREVMRNIEAIGGDRTMLLIAHRLSTVAHCDKIIVIDHGHLVEQGTPDELLAKGGFYANLYRQQNPGA